MKVQYLAVVFIIIMLPISLVFSEYISAQLETVSLQMSYDTKLDNATYDAIKAFQINTINNSDSDIADSKIRDVEASANAFFKSMGTSFNMMGYDSEALSNYVPALVYTLYDGFYIYSQFENILSQTNVEDDSEYKDGDSITGLKSYISYSCRYKKGNIDVTITYSLDNYITVQGYDKNGKGINIAGYLLDNVSYDSSNNIAYYRNIKIEPEEVLTQYVGDQQYKYVKINGVRYYKSTNPSNTTGWFSIQNSKIQPGQSDFNDDSNDMGVRYYKEAVEFKKELQEAGIDELKPEHAQGMGDILDESGNVVYSFMDGPNSNNPIFDFGNDIEEPDSNFNEHRLAVIRYVIESNLATALANYNHGTYNFTMPKLSEEDWATILNNVSLISFLQGLSIGGKIYNGYSVINNNKNEEVVTENSIYIIEDKNDPNSVFHRITHKPEELKSIITNTNDSLGVFNMDLERKTLEKIADDYYYYYPYRQLGCYSCYITHTSSSGGDISNIYDYIEDKFGTTGPSSSVAKLYYTALGRERYSMYKVFRDPEEHEKQFLENP